MHIPILSDVLMVICNFSLIIFIAMMIITHTPLKYKVKPYIRNSHIVFRYGLLITCSIGFIRLLIVLCWL